MLFRAYLHAHLAGYLQRTLFENLEMAALLTGQPFPNSQKVYVEGSQPGVRVGMREITLSDTFIGGTDENPVYESNEPLRVYDTSGPYTDPNFELDVRIRTSNSKFGSV